MPSQLLPRFQTRNATVILATFAVSAFGATHAAETPTVDTSEWTCNDCPFDDTGKVTGQIEVGAIHVSEDSARFGRYSGLDQQGVRPVLSGSVSQTNASGTRWSAEGRNLGLDSRSLDLRGGKPGLDLRLGYLQQPNHLFDTTSSPFFFSSPGVLALPSGWVRAGNTGLMTSLAASLKPRPVESERRTVSAGLRAALGANWSTYADYRHQKRDGTWRQSASFGFSAVELPRPIEDITDSVALGLRFANPKLTAQFGYDGSFYSNRRVGLAWSNPYLGPARGQLALAPDNSAHQFSGTLNYRFSDRTSLAAAAAFGQLQQDDAFLPYTINALPVVAAAPRASLDGTVHTTHFSLALMTGLDGLFPFLKSARVKVDFRYDERDNRTPISSYSYVVTDQFTSSAASNLPYDFRNQRLNITGDYDLRQLLHFVPARQTLRISGGFRHDDVHRSLQEVADLTEDTGWGRLAWKPTNWLDLAVKGGGANRKIDRYQTNLPILVPQNPLLRKYNMADRERQFAEASFTLQPLAKLSLVATGRYANDDYINSRLGLRNSREVDSTVALSWTPTEKMTWFADYAWEHIRARQAGSAAFSIPDWYADSHDRFRSGGAGVRITGIAKALDVDLRGFFANSVGDTMLTTPTVDNLPPLRSRMNGGEIAATWQRSSPLTVRAALRYEHLDARDRALDGVLPATIPTVLSMGAKAYDYDLVTVMLTFRYLFAAEEKAAAAK